MEHLELQQEDEALPDDRNVMKFDFIRGMRNEIPNTETPSAMAELNAGD